MDKTKRIQFVVASFAIALLVLYFHKGYQYSLEVGEILIIVFFLYFTIINFIQGKAVLAGFVLEQTPDNKKFIYPYIVMVCFLIIYIVFG